MPTWEVFWQEVYNCTATVEAESMGEAVEKARVLDSEQYTMQIEEVRKDSWYVEGISDDEDDEDVEAILNDPREVAMNRWDGESDPVPEF